jgi:uncharacterized GH25 family protein
LFGVRCDLHLPANAETKCSMNHRRAFFIITLTLIATFVSFAHDTWFAPRRFRVKEHKQIIFDLTSGMSFPTLETSIKPDRVHTAGCRLDNKFQEFAKPMTAPKSLVFVGTFNQEGISTCWIDLNPRQLELNDKLVEEYFEEIDASQAVRDRWQNMKKPRRWRESYVKHAKTFVYVGDHGKDQSWSEPVGMALEIVPIKNPAALKVGDELPIRLLRNGKPVPNLRVNMILAGQKQGEFQTTDNDGHTSFRIMRAGNYLLRATELRPSTKPDLEWESDFSTLTIEIR